MVDKQHEQALRELAERLRTRPEIAALCPEQVFGPDKADELSEWSRGIAVRAGQCYRKPNHPKNRLVQCDAKIEIRGENKEMMDLLCKLVKLTLSGAAQRSGNWRQMVHTHSGHAEDMGGYWVRRDVYATFCQPDPNTPADGPAVVTSPPKRLPVGTGPVKLGQVTMETKAEKANKSE